MDGNSTELISLPSKVRTEINNKGIEEYLKIKEYNDSCFEIPESVKLLKINGTRVLIRLFRLEEYKPDGFFVGGRTQTITSPNGQMKERPSPWQHQYRGVIHSIGTGCTEVFKKENKVGDVVDIQPGYNFMNDIFLLDRKREVTSLDFNYYATFPDYSIQANLGNKGNYEKIIKTL